MPPSGSPESTWRRRWRSQRFVVADDSMTPALLPGDRLLVDPRPADPAPPPIGSVVVLHDPEAPERLLVKRLASVEARTGLLTVVGDHAARSRDSRAFGPVAPGLLVGVAWYRYLPSARRGPIPTTAVPPAPKP